jgi:hypothetical protein
MHRFLLAFGLLVCFAAEALARPAMTTEATTMHATASARGRVVQAIPANAEIDLIHCGRSWCLVSWRNLSGYVIARSVEAMPIEPPPEPDYIGPPVVVAPYYGWGAEPWGWGPGYYGRGWGWGYRWH